LDELRLTISAGLDLPGRPVTGENFDMNIRGGTNESASHERSSTSPLMHLSRLKDGRKVAQKWLKEIACRIGLEVEKKPQLLQSSFTR